MLRGSLPIRRKELGAPSAPAAVFREASVDGNRLSEQDYD
jgi:hypothetical protein